MRHPLVAGAQLTAQVRLHCMQIGRGENGMDIFLLDSRSNSFKEVYICPYQSPDIEYQIPYTYQILKSYIYDDDIQSYLIQHG
jgi:hypothetical protein